MGLISVHELRWGVGEPLLLDGIGFTIEKGERIGLLGRNGAGKSSLASLEDRISASYSRWEELEDLLP